MFIYIQLVLTQILQGEKIQSLVYVASSTEDSDFIFGTALSFLPFFFCVLSTFTDCKNQEGVECSSLHLFFFYFDVKLS